MLRKLCLGLLLSTTFLWAQPVDGPFIVVEGDSSIHHIHVAARNDSIADVFWQVGNDAYHAAFSLANRMVYSGPNLFAAAADGYARTLEDAIALAEGWQVVAYDLSTNWNSTMLFAGGEMIAGADEIDSGLNWCPDGMPFCNASANDRLAFSHRNGLLCLNWTDNWQFRSDWLQEGGSDYTFLRFFGEFPYPVSPFAFQGPMEGRIFSLSQDLDFMVGWSPWNILICTTVETDCFANSIEINCEAAPIEFLLTSHGRMLALCEARDDGNWWNVGQRFIEIDTAANTCIDLLSLDTNPLAATSHPSFGFAWLSQPSSGLLLNRADTTGALVHEAGVIDWPDEDTRITGSNIAMTDSGKIMVVWTTEQIANPGPSELWIADVNWDTPLSSEKDNFIPHPSSLSLSSYPNPFNSSVRVSFDLPQSGAVSLSVHDVLGREVAILIHQTLAAGSHDVTWSPDGPSGIYFATLRAVQQTRVQKIMYIR